MVDLKEGDAGLSFTCAICCDVIYEWERDWVMLRVSSAVSAATQELYAHKRCIIEALGDCIPLGEVFE